MVEQSTAASHGMTRDAQELAASLATLKVEGQTEWAAAPMRMAG